MKPYLFERMFTPTMCSRCEVICEELGMYRQGDSQFEHKYGSLYISSGWGGGIVISINNIVLYRNGWMIGVKSDCKYKIYNAIDRLFEQALDTRYSKLEQQRKQEQRDADERNQICKEFNVEGD